MELTITDNIKSEDRDEIFSGLLEYNLARIEDKNPRDLGIYYEDTDGHKLAGLIGDTHGNWLTVDYLWVTPERRGEHIGISILRRAENESRARGCKYVFLNTFSFQAPEFYKKYGYEEVFALANYPLTGKRHYFVKNLLNCED